MAKSTKSQVRSHGGRRSQPKPRDGHTGDIALTIGAVIVAVWAGAPWLTPLLITAPIAFHLAKGVAEDADASYYLFRRWSVTVLVTCIAVAAFAPLNTFQSVPWGQEVPDRVDAWMAGTAGPPLGTVYMLVAGVAFLALTAGSAGVLGALVFSSTLALNAVYATYLFSRGHNVIHMAFVAISPWQWCFMVGLFVLWTPLSVYSRAHVLRREGTKFEWETHRTRIFVGIGLLVAAFVVRLALAGAYETIVRRLTVY